MNRLSVILALILALGIPTPVLAMDRTVRSAIVGGEYGLVFGSAGGLLSYAFTQDWRTIFQGTSVGLYLGIAVGIYYSLEHDNPENPLRGAPPPDPGAINGLEQPQVTLTRYQAPPVVNVKFEVMRF